MLLYRVASWLGFRGHGSDGGRRVVTHVGPVHTGTDLGLLVERAQRLLENPRWGKSDSGLERAAARAMLIGHPGGRRSSTTSHGR